MAATATHHAMRFHQLRVFEVRTGTSYKATTRLKTLDHLDVQTRGADKYAFSMKYIFEQIRSSIQVL